MADILIQNLSPKQRFMQSGDNVSKHKDLVDSRDFERGSDFAMLQYQAMLAQQTGDSNSAMANGFKFAGAMEFLQTMKMLAEAPRVSRPVISDNLKPTP